MTMSAWPLDELNKISKADDLHVSPLRGDGRSYGTPTWIWSVAVRGDLYVRAYNGRRSRWYQAALLHPGGRIRAAGVVRDVVFESADGSAAAAIDDAYRTKYRGSAYVDAMVGDRARSATFKIVPARLANDEGA
jgi:hypothetical protein